MSDLQEVQMTLIPLVKRDHPRWTTNRCRVEALKLAKKFMADLEKSQKQVRAKWPEPITKPQWDIISKRIRVS